MHLEEAEARAQSAAPADITVWDTQYCPPSKAFSVFREAISTTFMPWSPEFVAGRDFEGRVESIAFDQGALARVQMTPVVATRTKLNLANSPLDCIYANYVIAGELKVEQGGRTSVARRGDLVAYDSSLPVTLTERHETRYEDLAFLIPKCKLTNVRHPEASLNNVLIPGDRMIGPLSSALSFVSQNMLKLSRSELGALFDACVSLLPVAAGCFENRAKDYRGGVQPNYLMNEMLEFINRNIASAELSPHDAASHAGISVRYVHKLFAASGTTFGAYVVARRLDHVRRDLVSPACRHQPIFVVAYRWGFNDLSTFIRAFKKRYGCSPSRFKSTV
jgi:AraC-like DNA-binding protein